VSNADPLLTAALRGMADEDAHAGASERVAARLRAEFRSVAAAERSVRIRRGAVRLATAAVLVTAIAVPAWRLTQRRAAAGTRATALAAREIVTDFMPLTYSDVPLSGGQIVRLEVPRAAIESFCLAPSDAARGSASGDTVLADVIVGDDGLARAVRFVRSGP